MSQEDNGQASPYPGARVRKVLDARRGSTAYFTRLLVDARRVAARFNGNVDLCWTKAGGVVEAETSYIARELKHAVEVLLEAPALNAEHLDDEDCRAIEAAHQAPDLTRA